MVRIINIILIFCTREKTPSAVIFFIRIFPVHISYW